MFLLQKPDPQIADFLAPLSFEVCVTRLTLRGGKFYNIQTFIHIDEVNQGYHTFDIHVKRTGSERFDCSVSGSLSRQDSMTTRVVLQRQYAPNYRNMGFSVISCLILGALAGMFTDQLLPFLYFAVLSIPLAVINDRHPIHYNNTVEMIQETLGVRKAKKKAKFGKV